MRARICSCVTIGFPNIRSMSLAPSHYGRSIDRDNQTPFGRFRHTRSLILPIPYNPYDLLCSRHHWNPRTVAAEYFQIGKKVLELLRATLHTKGTESIPLLPRPHHQWSGDSVGIHH